MKLFVYRPGVEEIETREVEKPVGYHKIAALVEPLIGARLEHVSVLFEGRRADMFVGDESALDGSPVNEAATRIYHAASLARGQDMTGAPPIYGVAVVCSEIVWR